MKLITLLIFITASVAAQTPSKTRVTLNFNDTIGVVIDTTQMTNVWQIGMPNKSIFDSAYSAPNAITTATSKTYPISNTSEFTFKTPTYMPNYGGVDISFWHKFDTDTLKDGGAVMVSTDNAFWVNILDGPTIWFCRIKHLQNVII